MPALSKLNTIKDKCYKYKHTWGCPSFKTQLKDKLQNKHFSLNFDVATNNAMDKIYTVT